MSEQIEADTEWDDDNADEFSMNTGNSAANSIFEYRYENGRRYHAYRDGIYAFPNDEKEQTRLDLVHQMFLLLLGGELHIAPLCESPTKILDIGTGTGIWAIDMGERYPSTEIIGTDLSPIQPSWVPPNVNFQIDDAESEWAWQEESFDMVHIRHLGGAISDWPTLFARAYKSLKPGGWIDMCEFLLNLYSDDGTYNSDSCLGKYYELTNEAARRAGRLFTDPIVFQELLGKAGFENQLMKVFKVPTGTWPADPLQKKMGEYFMHISETGFEALGMALITRQMGMDPDDAKKLIDGAFKEIRNRKIHSYTLHHFLCAQKPVK